MTSRLTFAAAALTALLAAAPASAQTHACDITTATTFSTTTGRPFTAQWCLPTTTTVNGAEIPMRVDGFTIQVDATPAIEVGKPVSGVPSATSKLQLYSYVVPSGTAKGSHTVTVIPWNYTLDVNGVPTTIKQPGGPLIIPFVASDPAMIGPPPAPTKGRIIR